MNYSSAIGANALVNSDGKIIIGSNLNPLNSQPIHVGIGLSDDTYAGGPRSQLELNTDPAMSVSGVTGSGLQFRQLISTSPLNIDTYLAPYGKVLTVDTEGKVKLTDGGTGFGYGICDNYTVLPNDIGMNFRDHRIYHFGQGYTGRSYDMNNAMGIGYSCEAPLPGKLSVDQSYTTDNVDVPTIAGFFHNGDVTTSGTTTFQKRSVLGVCNGLSLYEHEFGITNIGGDFEATNSSWWNIGVRGRTGWHGEETYGNEGIGGYFASYNSSLSNIGVFARTDGRGSDTNYGIYAYAPLGSCGDYVPCFNAAGYFNGDVYTTASYFISSDLSLKDNIQPLQNAKNIIRALNPKTFTYRTSQISFLNMSSGQQAGLIAQEVKNILPQLVKGFKLPLGLDSIGNADTTGTGNSYLAVNYLGLIPYLIAYANEQQNAIDSLSSNMITLLSLINNCCGNGVGLKIGNINGSTIDVKLGDITTIILNQNTPNPFSEETFINYTVPKEVLKAIIMIYDNVGQVLKSVTISERGEGSLHVYAEKLSSGIYSYSLIADGKTIDTKQMVCQK